MRLFLRHTSALPPRLYLPSPSLPYRDHQSLRLVVFSLRPELPHLDEVFLKINGRFPYLWRAVDQDAEVFDILLQSHRDKKTSKHLFRKLLKTLATSRGWSSQTSWGATVRRRLKWCRASNTSSRSIRTIEPRILISQPDWESGWWGVSSHPATTNVFSRPSESLPHFRVGICTELALTEHWWNRGSPYGKRRSASRRLLIDQMTNGDSSRLSR